MKSFEIKITGNAKSLVDSIKSSQSAMDALIKGIDKADKKLEVLTQTGSHLSNIDKQLAKLKTDYPDIFEKIFPNIDSQINESMKPILQMPELVEQIMTKVVQKMKSIDNGVLKVTDDDIKELGNDMRLLGETLHLEKLDMGFLDGTAKAETKIKRLIDVMGRLVEAYYNVNMATTNVNVENVAQKKNGLKKSKGNIKTSPVDDEENMKKELSELEKYQQILKVINGEDIKLKTTKKDDLEQLKLLVAQFDEATNAVKRFEAARDTDSDKYKEALAEQYRLAVLLKNTMDDVADNGSEKAVNFISSQTGKFGAYSKAEELINTGFGPNLTKDIGEIFTKKIEKASFSYDRLTESVERFYEILQKVNNDDNLTDEETDALYEEAENIKKTFESLDIRTKDFFENLSLGVINTKEAIQELTKMFGIELPAAMDKPEEKIQKLLPTSEGLEKLRIIPDGDQKARISEYAEEYRVILKLLQQGNIESKETISALRERARTLKDIIKGVNPGDTTLDKLLTDGYGISKGTANTVASANLSSKFQIDAFKSENISNDARQEAINLIHQEIVAENQLAQKKKEELEDAKIKAKENEEARIAAEAEAKAAKEAAEAARLQAEEKEKARLAAEAEAKVAHSQSNVSSNNKILLYRYGRTDFSDKDFAYSDTMGEIVDSLKIGFGGFGDGMYSVVGSAVNDIVQSMTKPTDSNHDYFEIDASKYKLFINQTEEEASRLQSFLMNLQKFVLSAGDFRGFDDDIANIDNNSLFNEAKSIFKQFDMKQDEFNSWIQQMKQIVVDNKLDSNGKFNTEDAEFLKSHNFGTRFMQKLGYEGIVNKTGNVEFDGMAQGSVIFDPNYEEIIKYLEETGNKSKWAADLLKLFKQEAVDATSSTENGDAAGSSFEWLNDGVEKAKRTLEEFRLLQNEILGKSATAEGGSMDGEAIGRYTERVETAKAKLDELAKQSLLTADQIKEANDIYETTIGNLESKSRANNEHIEDLEGREQVGSYDSGYDRGYYDARSEADSELDNLRKQLNEAEAELNRAKTSMDSGTPIDTSVELQSLEKLRAKLEEVKNAIIAKNKAFNDEGTIVGQVVGKEVNALSILLTRINDVSDAITQLINNINSSSEISTGLSNVNINVNGKVGEGSSSVDVSSITSAIKEAIYSKDITKAGYTKLTDFNQAFDIKYDLDTGDIQNITSKLTGEIFDTIEEAMAEFNRYYKDLFINKNDSWDILSKEDLFSKIENNSNNDDWARVVVDAINTQGNNIVQALKIIPSQNASDTINEAELIKAFQIVAQSVAHDINPRDFFQGIIDGTIVPEQNLAQAMQTLGMLSNDLKATFSLADTGMRNLGVAIAENIVIPSRPAYLDETKELAPLLDKAVDLGAAVPRILSSFNDAEKVIELQTRMPGTNLGSSKFNPEDLINATDKQIDGLLNTLEALSKVGLFPDFTGDNILFDKNKGFSLVDVESKFEGWMHGNVDTFEGMVEYLKDYIYQLASDSPFDGSKATLSEEQAELFNRRLSNRAALAPEDRLVNFDTIRAQNEVQKGEGVNVKITPIMDEGAIAQVVTENVANTPVTVKINPEIDNQDSTDKGNQIPQQKAAYDSINNLEGAIDNTTSAINDKTQAFDNELETVQRVIQQEIQELDNLLNKINDVTGAVNANAEAFQAEGNAVSESVKQTAKSKENNKISNTSKPTKKVTSSQTDKETTSAATAAKAKQDGILNAIEKEILKSYKSTGISVLDEVPEELASTKTAYDDLIDKINDYKSKGVALSDDIINGLKEEARAIKAVMDAYAEKTKQQAKSDKKESSEKQKPSYKNSVMNSLQKKYFQSYSLATDEEFAISPSVISAAEKLKSTWEELNRLNKEIGNTKPTEAQEIAFNRLTDEFNQAKKELDGIISSTRKLSGKSLGTFNLFDAEGKSEFDLTNIEDRKRALLEAVNTLSEGKAKIGDFDAAYKELSYTVKNADGKWVDMKASINAAGTAIEVVAGKTKSRTSAIGQFIDQLKGKFKSIAQYLISMAGYQEIIQQVRKCIQYVKEIDSALTELKKVTDETDETYEKFLDTASKVGSEIGSTIANFTDATADFARLGYSISEATELAKAASVYKNVGDGIDSVAQATESIISTMKAFGIEADNSMAIVDKFNEVGNNFAISSTGIGEALQRSASALYESGNTIDESIGLITAANSVIQNPEQVGTALKTLSLRLRGAKVELEEAGEDVDGMADSVSSLQAKLLALTHGKVDIMADASTFKNTTQILREMSKAWEDMTDIERSAALELMGGKRQANILASIIKNYDTVDSVIESSINSQNSAYEENIKWMDSIEGKMTKFNNAVQSLWQDTLGSNAIKDVVDLGTGLVKILDTIGVIPSILGGIAIYFTAIKKNNPITMFKDLMNTIQNFSTAVTNVQTLSKAGVVFDSNSVSTYAAAVSDLSAKQQALALSSAGLTKQQVAEVLAKNGCSEATIEQAVAEASLATAKATTNTITGEQLLNLATEKDIKLSEQAVTWLTANAEAELTREKILAAIASKDLAEADGMALLAMSGLSAGAKGLGASLKTLFLSNPVGLALMAVTAITAIVSAVKRAKEEAKQAAQETLNAYKDAQNTLNSNKNTINEISSDYERLSKGVDDFGNNISLTTDEYKKYNEITNKIADMFPEMISGYTKEGNAILLCKGNVEELTKAYEAAEQAARQAAIAGGNDVFDSAKEEYNSNPSVSWEGTGLKQKQKLANKLVELSNQGTEEEIQKFFSDLNAGNVEIDGEKYSNIELDALFKEAGIDISDFRSWWDGSIDVDKYKEKMRSLESFIKTSVTKINTETSKVRSILSAYLGEDEDYAKLDDETKSIINNIVSQLDSEFVFSFDNIDSLYNWVSENIVQAFSGNNGKVQNAIKDFLKIDTSSLSVTDYKKEIKNFKKVLSDSGISEEAQQQILSAFKIDDDSIKAEIDPLVNHTKSILKDEFDNKVDDLTISDLKIIDTLDIPEGTLLTWDELLEKIQEVKSKMQSPIVNTYSSNKESVESLTEASTILNEATSDGVQLTNEQGESLKKLIGTQEGYSDAIDETNGYVVKNATLLRRLIAQKKEEQRATIRAAKSYAQLQYKNTTKQLYQLVAAMKNEYQANGKVSSSTLKNVEALRAQIAELKKTTHEYAILELKLSDVTNAYQEFEDAKNTDSELSYGDSMIEMLNTINDGFKTGQVGTEAFRTAVEALVPSSVYSDLDNFNDRMVAIHDYIDKNPLFADWFTIKDGEFSITQKNIQAFVEDAQKSGAFTQSDANGNFFLADDINSIDKFVDKINKGAEGAGVTKEAVIAMLTEFSKYDASWSDILSDLTTNSFDKEVNKCTDALDNALLAQENFIRSGGDLNSDEWKTICDNVEKAKIELDNATESANNNATTWIQLETLYSATTGEMKLTQLQADKLAQSLGLISEDQHITIEDGAIKLTQEQCDILNQKRQELEEPSIMTIQTNYDQIVAQIDELQRYIDDKLTPKEEKEIEAKYNIKNKEEAKAQINDVLNPEKNEIELKYNITKTSDEQTQGDIEKLKDWEANGVKFKVSAEIDEDASNTVKETEKDLGKDMKPLVLPQVDEIAKATAEKILDDIAKDRTSTVYVNTVETGSNSTNTSSGGYSTTRRGRFNGTANASGNWGLEKSEHNSLVGELGTETVVDPHTGRYYTVGDHGAELVDLPKDAIIFNHLQTKELFKNGHINSRGKLTGGAYAEGNAHYGLFDGYTNYGEVFKNGSDNWVGAWDDTLRDLSDSADSLSGAADDISGAVDKFEETFDWFAILLEEIENSINLMNAQLENAVGINSKKNIYYQILDTEYFKVKELNEGIKLYTDYSAKLLAKVPDKYKEMAKNGAVAITDFLGEANQEVVEAINNYREWANKVTDLNQQLEETKKNISDTHVEIQNMVKDEYDNRISLITAVNDRIQGTIDLLDEEGRRSSAVMYEEMIKNSTKQLSELQNKRAEMQQALDKAVSSGDVEKGKSQWYEMVNAISDVDSEINDCKVALEGFQNSINQLHWDNFEKFIDTIDNVGTEISNLGDLIDEEDVVDEIGNWTKKGITAIGLYAQEMERAKYRAEQYGKEIEYLNQEYADGKYSVDEYNEKLQELRDGQWDSIKSYEAAKKAIVDLNKTRVEAIKNGIEKEISTYQELIDKKKEELQLQKDSHDFSKQVAEQQKNIADLQKKLAVMAGDNSASAIAQKKQLQAELAAAQEELDELYYSHSVEKQGEALDKQLESYQDSKDKEMDQLDESLKNEEQVIADSYATIAANTESVAQTLAEIASQYGITLSDSVTKPWLDGANAIGTYKEQLDTSMSSFTKQLESLRQMYVDLQNQADSTGKSMISAINGNKSKTESATYTPPKPSKPSTPSKPSKPSAPSVGASVTVKKSAKNFSRDGGNGTRMQSWVPGSTFTVYQVSGSEVLIGRNGGYTGWVKLSDIQGYSSGIKKVPNDQLAMIDELGLEELVLHADGNGKLAFLSKGTSVIPSDITENLMKLGTIDPTTMLERNKPSIGAPHITNNNMEINMEFGSLVHVDTVNKDTLPDLQKMVRSEFDNCMKNINQGLKRYTR